MSTIEWFACAVALALALPALFVSMLVEADRRWLFLAVLWSPAVVATVVAAVLVVDRAHVSDTELADAADRAVQKLSGTTDSVGAGRIEITVETYLGHAVDVSSGASGAIDETGQSQDTTWNVTAGDAAVCMTVTTGIDYVDRPGTPYTTLSTAEGACS